MTQTVPDISPLMPMHQDPLLVSILLRRNFLSVHSIVLALFLHYHTMFNRAFDDCYIRKYVFEVAFRICVPGDERRVPEQPGTRDLIMLTNQSVEVVVDEQSEQQNQS